MCFLWIWPDYMHITHAFYLRYKYFYYFLMTCDKYSKWLRIIQKHIICWNSQRLNSRIAAVWICETQLCDKILIRYFRCNFTNMVWHINGHKKSAIRHQIKATKININSLVKKNSAKNWFTRLFPIKFYGC